MAVWPYTTQRWQRLQKAKRQDKPLCERCLKIGRIEAVAAVDHIKPISRGGDPYPALDQLMSLCARCHNQKTRLEQLGQDDRPAVIKGCDIHGIPLDPNHSWNLEKKKRGGR